MSATLFVVFTLTAFSGINAECFGVGCSLKGEFPKTKGAVWPQPQSQTSTDDFLVIKPYGLRYKVLGKDCDILENARTRYITKIFDRPRTNRIEMNFRQNIAFLYTLNINLVNACDDLWPNADMDEQYELKINTEDLPGEALIYAQSIWGILRGLETFSHLVHSTGGHLFVVNTTRIRDYPRFPHRGLLLDTGKHFLPKKYILETLEAMAQNKFNVFHWHIVDDESFPYESNNFPQMSRKGSYDHVRHTYRKWDIIDILQFARERGIRVIPEFDTPGHTQSWGLGVPGLLTPCYKTVNGKKVKDGFGPIDPTVESSYEFLRTFLLGVSNSFRDKYIHLGGDEVNLDCWKSNPDVLDFMARKGFGNDFSKLEQYYMQRLLVKSFPQNNSYIVWQEVIDNGVEVKSDTVVQVWKKPFKDDLNKITKKGYRTLLSSCWFLDNIKHERDWEEFYPCDPQEFPGSEDQKKLVLGGEALMWGEYVDETNLTPRLWPRASAVAERLWSDKDVNDPDAAAPRLEEHRCRMYCRGINAEPANGPGYCECWF